MANLLAHLFVIGIGVTIVTAEDAFVRNVTELVKLNTNIEISLTDIKDPYWIQADGPGVVNGFRTCGGSGTLYTLRYETCTGDHRVPCQVPGDDALRHAEMHFSSSRDYQALGVRVYVSTKGIPPTVIFEKYLENVTVWKAYKYSMNAKVGANAMFKGRKVSLQFEMFGLDDGITEICAAADFEVI